MSRSVPRPLLAAVVVPLVMILGLQSAWAAYACSVDGKVRDRCCCKSKRDDGSPSEQAPRIARPDCCEVSVLEHRDQPAARETAHPSFGSVELVAPVAIAAPVVVRVERVVTRSVSARAPPRVPLFLQKQAILR